MDKEFHYLVGALVLRYLLPDKKDALVPAHLLVQPVVDCLTHGFLVPKEVHPKKGGGEAKMGLIKITVLFKDFWSVLTVESLNWSALYPKVLYHSVKQTTVVETCFPPFIAVKSSS